MPIDFYTPRTMKGALKRILPVRTFFKSRFFGNSVTFPTKTVSFEFKDAKRRLAPYVSDRIGSKSVERDGYEIKTFMPTLVAPDRPITEDTLAQKLLGESLINSGVTPDERAASIAAQDLMDLQEMVTRRIEYMCARVKQDGALSIIGDGVNRKVDYEFENIVEVESSDVWTPDSDIMGMLGAGGEELSKFGVNPDMLILGTAAAEKFLDNKKILRLLDNRRVEIGEIRPSDMENGIRYLGRVATPKITIEIYSYGEWYPDDQDLDEDGEPKLKPLVDPETAILQSSTEQNSILYGAITLSNTKTEEFETYMDEVVPDSWMTKKPAQRFISLSSRPLPMPHDLKSWMVFKNVVTGS